MSDELRKKQEHLASLEDFLQSPAFLGFKTSTLKEIQDLKDSIVSIDPVRLEDFVEECKLRGELRVLEQLENVFEEARVTLKSRIDAMVEVELENATNTRK